MARILVVDDNEPILQTLKHLLLAAGHSVATAADGREAEKLFRAEPFDLIITDIVMPDRDGLETIMTLRRDFPHLAVIAMSGGAAPVYLDMAKKLGARRTLPKPFTPQVLHAAIADSLSPPPAK